ncbi:MAG: hypothetical protein WCO56_29315 [Verrucomicrobiota bacterium]
MQYNVSCKVLALVTLLGACAGMEAADALPSFDFKSATVVREWGTPHHIPVLRSTDEGLEITIAGNDPYFHGPARDYPAGELLTMRLRLKSEQGGMGQFFYYQDQASPEQVVSFPVPRNRWVDLRIPFPALRKGYHLRFDPPGQGGKCIVDTLRMERRLSVKIPVWPPMPKLVPGAEKTLTSGDLELWANPQHPAGYELRVHGRSMAVGFPHYRVGYLWQEQPVWVNFPVAQVVPAKSGSKGTYAFRSRLRDAQGAEWLHEQEFQADAAGTIRVETRVTVSQNREVLFLPMTWLAAGAQSFGTNKHQGLFAGLEYLDNEPSSSTADIEGPQAQRQVPANHKITFPLMAIEQAGHYVGLIWEDHLQFSAVFDSPDRLVNSGGHLMGVLWPQSDGENREEGSLVPYSPQVLIAGKPLTLRAKLIGGVGDTVVAAVQHYVRVQGWPKPPETGLNQEQYVSLAAYGWLNSKIRRGNLYRHAYWPGFGPTPAADAALFQSWLAQKTTDASTRQQLIEASAQVLQPIPVNQLYHSGVGHVRTPAAALAFNEVRLNLETARAQARHFTQQLSAQGVIRYHPTANRPDYGRTYHTNHANGLTAQVVYSGLAAAAFSGDPSLISNAVQCLKGLSIYRQGVPRGAQTWEIPLHTPDILASAHLVHAYVIGYELTGDTTFLEEARYWAWTGVPFVYLVAPTEYPVGPYSTIAVLGATGWRAPVWFGQPVQWCGLVYADALYQLAVVDANSPWRNLADGITRAGLQHTWKALDVERAGLLPDFYLLAVQQSDGSAINPATVGINAVRLYGGPPIYEFRAARRSEVQLHAPGGIQLREDKPELASFTVQGWPGSPYSVLAPVYELA